MARATAARSRRSDAMEVAGLVPQHIRRRNTVCRFYPHPRRHRYSFVVVCFVVVVVVVAVAVVVVAVIVDQSSKKSSSIR